MIHGVPERERGSRVDHIESYHARPLTSENGVPTPWRVEIFTTEDHETLVSEEPATLSMEMWRRDKAGRLTPEDRVLLDEWGYPRHDPVERLVVRWPGGNRGTSMSIRSRDFYLTGSLSKLSPNIGARRSR